MRIGQGIDAHKFCEGDHVILGGVKIPHDQGIEAHSDGDVLIHALIDALLGAAGMGDIGQMFPDSDDQYKGIDSGKLLQQVITRLRMEGFSITNIDATVIAQAPRLGPHIAEMRKLLAKKMSVGSSSINIKATTTEHMGFTGRGEGIAAMAVVLLHVIDTE